MSVVSCRKQDFEECKKRETTQIYADDSGCRSCAGQRRVTNSALLGVDGLSLVSLDPEIVIADGFELAVNGEAIKRDDVVLMRED